MPVLPRRHPPREGRGEEEEEEDEEVLCRARSGGCARGKCPREKDGATPRVSRFFSVLGFGGNVEDESGSRFFPGDTAKTVKVLNVN